MSYRPNLNGYYIIIRRWTAGNSTCSCQTCGFVREDRLRHRSRPSVASRQTNLDARSGFRRDQSAHPCKAHIRSSITCRRRSSRAQPLEKRLASWTSVSAEDGKSARAREDRPSTRFGPRHSLVSGRSSRARRFMRPSVDRDELPGRGRRAVTKRLSVVIFGDTPLTSCARATRGRYRRLPAARRPRSVRDVLARP